MTDRPTPAPTGRLERAGGDDILVWTRTFRAPIADVWAAVTESERLARWIGTWHGDPTDGFVTFTMNAEGEDMPPERYDIRECTPPRALRIDSTDESGAWHLRFDLDEADGVTTLTFTQVIDDPEVVEHTGPGWEHYLERLTVAFAGADPAVVDWEATLAATSQHYLDLAATMRER